MFQSFELSKYVPYNLLTPCYWNESDIVGTATINHDRGRIQEYSTTHATTGCDVASKYGELCVTGRRNDDMFGGF